MDLKIYLYKTRRVIFLLPNRLYSTLTSFKDFLFAPFRCRMFHLCKYAAPQELLIPRYKINPFAYYFIRLLLKRLNPQHGIIGIKFILFVEFVRRIDYPGAIDNKLVSIFSGLDKKELINETFSDVGR